jgi:hypothetical protein
MTADRVPEWVFYKSDRLTLGVSSVYAKSTMEWAATIFLGLLWRHGEAPTWLFVGWVMALFIHCRVRIWLPEDARDGETES